MARTSQNGSELKSGGWPGAQHGFGGFFMMFLLAALGATTALLTFARTDTLTAKNDRAILDALVEAKAALVGYAVRRGGPTGTARPGELPCPDTDGDGMENTPCSTPASLLGRVPWRTLGIPEPRDSAGETLWYAISAPFRDVTSNPNPTPPHWLTGASDRINSDTRGTITVRGADGAILTDNAVAVILAPGAPIGQNRGVVGTLLCTLTGLLVAQSACPNNYFESITIGGTLVGNAASTSGPFIAGARSNTFNDRLTYITTSELIPLLEMRVGRELQTLLQGYYAARGHFPWTDNWPYSGGIADTGQSRGRFPTMPRELTTPWTTGASARWGEAGRGTPSLPAWLEANNWHNFFWYTVSRGYTNGTCKTCSANPVTVDGVAVKALILSPGTPSDGLGPRLTSISRRDDIDLYFDNPQNRTGANILTCPNVGEIGDGPAPSGNFQGQPACDMYITPTATGFDRDRIHTIQ